MFPETKHVLLKQNSDSVIQWGIGKQDDGGRFLQSGIVTQAIVGTSCNSQDVNKLWFLIKSIRAAKMVISIPT